MASINRLAIRGVRSFSPNDEEQAVEFFFPCTIIVGANGCGKTTIIESLKYAMTGAFPPGNKSGQAFVHDPRSIGSTNVKAQVKLRFTSKSSKSMVVIRSMELTQKKTTLSFKQLDGALRTLDTDTNKIVSLSHKCTELDKQLPILLGVSKPILEHVLFCHQEDASWPLQEGAVLKKRFDDIFDSTRYTKAIDMFRKTEKELHSKAKDIKAELSGLSSHRHAANGFRQELEGHNENLEQLEDEKKRIVDRMKEAEKTRDQADKIIQELDEVDAQIESADSQYTAKLEMVKKQKQMLEKDLTQEYSTPETLQKMLREYDQEVAHHADELERLQNQDQELTQHIQKFLKEERSLADQKTRLQTAQEQQLQRCQERYAKMEHMAQTYSLNLQLSCSQNANASLDGSFVMASQNTSLAGTVANPEQNLTQEDMENFFQVVDQKEQELDESYKETKTRHQSEEDKLVAQLSELQGKQKSVEAQRLKIADQREKATQEQRELMKQMETHGRVRKSDIEESRRQANRLAKERDMANSDGRRTQIPTEIRSLEEKIDQAKRKIEDDRIILDSLRHCAENQNAISMLKEQCAKDIENFEELFREQSFQLQKHNLKPDQALPKGEDDSDGRQLVSFVEKILDNVQAKHDGVKSDLAKAEEEVARSQRMYNERSAISASQQQSLQNVKGRLEQLEGDHGSVSKSKKLIDSFRRQEESFGLSPPSKEAPAQEFLTYVEVRLSEIEEDAPADDTDSAKRIFKKLTKKTRVADSSSPDGFNLVCPCCVRGLTGDQVRVFTERMEELKKDPVFVKANPQQVQEYKNKKSDYEKFRRQLNLLINDLRDHKRLREEKIQIEKQLENLTEDLSNYLSTLNGHKEEAKTIQDEVDELREILDSCRRWSGDVARIHEKRMQIDQKQQDLTLDMNNDTRDLRTVEREIADQMEEKDSFMNKINRLNKEMTVLNNRIAQLSTQASNMDKLVREKEQKFAATQKKEERKTELVDTLNKLQEEDMKLSEQLAPLKRKIEGKSRDKDRARGLKESEVSTRHNLLLEFQGEVKELRRVSKAIDDFLASEQTQDFDRIESNIAKVLEKVKEKQKDQKSLKVELDKLRDAVQDQERHKKMIRDNIDVIETELATKELQKEIDKLNEQKARIEGSDTADEDLKKAQKLINDLQSKLSRIEGEFFQVVEQIRSLKRKLSSEEYKNVEEEHRVAQIKFVTTNLAAEDLKKYWTAVDKALLKYHSVKIAEINKIVRELWLLTYKGEDIGEIKIVSGQDSGSRSTRSYNYRVVMTKGNSELDMRGRCSAGQRVLASIVIRLALAETFGVMCGCIALDEPTVNLDFPNKKGLATALAQIISSRSQQSNFQLILITHDEEFVCMVKTEMSMLTGFSMPEKYFQVRRERASDGKFYSKIDERDWAELV